MIYDDTNLCLLFIVDPTQSRVDFYKYFATQQVAKYINDPNEDGSKTASNGVFGALQLVTDYEKNNFGLVATDLTNTYEVENMMNIVRDFHKYDRMFDHHTSDVEAYEKYLEHLRKDYYEKRRNDDDNE